MKISEIRDWATATFGLHSHKEGQIHAALGPIEEWLGHLARQGIMLELLPTELAQKLGASPMKPLHEPGEPPASTNSGATSTVDMPDPEWQDLGPTPGGTAPDMVPDAPEGTPGAIPELDAETESVKDDEVFGDTVPKKPLTSDGNPPNMPGASANI